MLASCAGYHSTNKDRSFLFPLKKKKVCPATPLRILRLHSLSFAIRPPREIHADIRRHQAVGALPSDPLQSPVLGQSQPILPNIQAPPRACRTTDQIAGHSQSPSRPIPPLQAEVSAEPPSTVSTKPRTPGDSTCSKRFQNCFKQVITTCTQRCGLKIGLLDLQQEEGRPNHEMHYFF